MRRRGEEGDGEGRGERRVVSGMTLVLQCSRIANRLGGEDWWCGAGVWRCGHFAEPRQGC